MHILLIYYEVIADKVEKNIKHLIGAATCYVPEGLLIYPAGKGPVEEVYDSQDDIARAGQQILKLRGKNKPVLLKVILNMII